MPKSKKWIGNRCDHGRIGNDHACLKYAKTKIDDKNYCVVHADMLKKQVDEAEILDIFATPSEDPKPTTKPI